MTGTGLKQIRLSKGIKQTFIANRLGISTPSLLRLEKSDKALRFTYPQWLAVKDALNLDDIQMGAHE